MTKILTVTGHRPNKINKDLYSWKSPISRTYINFFMNYIRDYVEENGPTTCRSGMALGVDTMFAIATLRLKKEGYPVKLEACIPCMGQEKMWTEPGKALYQKILEEADFLTKVSDEPYNHTCMQDRNEYMVNGCSNVLAIWDGTQGGTGNCVEYAESQNVPVDIFHPKQVISSTVLQIG